MLPESCPFLYELFSKSVFLKTKESTVKGVAFDKMLLSDGFWPVTIITPNRKSHREQCLVAFSTYTSWSRNFIPLSLTSNEFFRDVRKQTPWRTLVNSYVTKLQGGISMATDFGDRHAFVTTSQTLFVKLACRS